ncbi:PIG-L deacetylase family protein [Sphingomonas oryzagri]|jgi:LmbE family N-acetylglucosaminyl deacetylase|uniref:PIG-L family deacetylase n=1 Tax=Sphingomonas oryzagri TaxID=3042314 RepID=A0ABT6N4C2_9SPHN|nr:PIG-L deacetylase family protein [Sphingomonas oryzagri]MDH7639201.1 PIG-L family deacetylase [Sphingomonas oryzagri]
MIALDISRKMERPLRVLCLGAHADDIEIGCGGTLLNLAAQAPHLIVHWVVFSGDDLRADEARRSAAALMGNRGELIVEVFDFQDGLFPHELPGIKAVFETIKRTASPDIILTHSMGDAHQDHAVIASLSHNTFRDHFVLGYEIPKYDGDLGRTNAYVHLTEAVARRKAEAIYAAFPSQRHRSWFSPQTFLSLAKIRGIECNAPEGFAEAFSASKMVLGI